MLIGLFPIGYFSTGFSFLLTLFCFWLLLFQALGQKHFFNITTALCLGWILPSLISYFPLYRFTHLTGIVDLKTHQFCLLISLLFAFQIIFFRNPGSHISFLKRGYGSAIAIYRYISYALYLLSFLGILLALRNSGYIFPLFTKNVSFAAEEFFRSVKLSGSLFSFGEIAIAITVIIIFYNKEKLSNKSSFLVTDYFLMFAYLTSSLFAGKRMPVFIIILTVLIISQYLNPNIFKVRKLIFITFLFILIFFINAYLRAIYGYSTFYEGKNIVLVKNVYAFTLLQSLLYIQPNFFNLSYVFNSSSYTFGIHSVFYFFIKNTMNDSYSIARENVYNMTTFLAPVIQDFGPIFGLIFLNVGFFFALKFERLIGKSPVFMIVFALFTSRFFLAFTGDLYFNNIFMSKIIFCFIIYFMIDGFRRYEKG